MVKEGTRKIVVRGFDINVTTFASGSCFMYPCFNGNAEYPASSKGMKDLRHYLGAILWMNRVKKEMGFQLNKRRKENV